MKLLENSALIQKYLDLLKLCKKTVSEPPTTWELLSPEEQYQLAQFHLQQSEESDLDTLITINQIIRDYKAKKKQLKLQRCQLATMSEQPYTIQK